MVSTRKKKQSIRSLFLHLGDFDLNIIFGNAAGDRQQNTVANEKSVDQILPLIKLAMI